jgi:hypothetical protein
MRIILAAAALAASVATAQAQLKPITIEAVRASVETGVPPLITQEDAHRFIDCGLPPIVSQAPEDLIRAQAEARATGTNLQVVWMRHNLKGIEACLARPGNH